MKLFRLYQFFREYLRSKNIESYEEDSKYLISSILSIPSHYIFTEKNINVPLNKVIKILLAMRKRAKRIPSAYILGYQYFYNHKFFVNRKTFIPRFDTEHLIYSITEMKKDFRSIIDLCTGSGILAITLSKIFPESEVIGIDRYVKIARKNAKYLGSENTTFYRMDFLKLRRFPFEKRFDLIISNPPYISRNDLGMISPELRKYEPFRAFWGGDDGLLFYRRIADFSIDFLIKNGYIVLEIDHKWKDVIDIFKRSGYNEKLMKVLKDYNNLERVLIIEKDF
ncbi:MAG: peptide chain release factor N(5)-glutamine methyltransferase [Brevinematia bacterium]